MEFYLRKIGGIKHSSMELTIVAANGNSIKEDVTNLQGLTPVSFIEMLKQTANDLEARNDFLTDKNQQ